MSNSQVQHPLTYLQIDRTHWVVDLIAGLTTAIVSTPKLIGFAIMAGVNPLYGLYTGVIATPIAALFTGSSTMTVVATTNVLAVTVFSTLRTIPQEQAIAALFTLTFLIGIFQILFGLLRFGSLSRFISRAVLVSFLIGSALQIVLSQLGHFTGYEAEVMGNPLLETWDWLTHVQQFDPLTMLVGTSATLLILIVERTPLHPAAMNVSLVLVMIATELLGWQVARVGDVSQIPAHLLMPVLPDFTLVLSLLVPSVAIAILGLVQAIGVTQGTIEPSGNPPDVNRDFIGQGLSNLAGGFFQCMPSCGSLSATAVNVKAGAKSRLSNIVQAIAIALLILLFGSLAERIPLAAMAGILIVIGVELMNKTEEIVQVLTISPVGRIAMLVTFLSTLILPLQYSIYVGIALSMLAYFY